MTVYRKVVRSAAGKCGNVPMNARSRATTLLDLPHRPLAGLFDRAMERAATCAATQPVIYGHATASMPLLWPRSLVEQIASVRGRDGSRLLSRK